MQMNLPASPDLRRIFQYPTISYVGTRSDEGRVRSVITAMLPYKDTSFLGLCWWGGMRIIV